MVRQQGDQRAKKNQTEAANLLNFHFATQPPPRESRPNNNNNYNRGRQTAGRSNNNSYGGRGRNNNNDRRTKTDRAEARRKANAQNFYLHSSPDHAFVLTRIAGRHQQYSFNGPDSAVSWESVRMVKYLSTEQQQQECCPICLDVFVCPRITKCGHCFCYSCVIHHVQAFCVNNPYVTTGPKCPCCAMVLHLEDLRPIQLITVSSPQSVSLSLSGPADATKSSSSSSQPKSPNSNSGNSHVKTMKFVKLHRVKGCPAPFLPWVHTPRRSSPHAAPCQTDADAPYCKFNYVDPVVYKNHLEYNLQELQHQQQQQQQQAAMNRGRSNSNAHDDVESVCRVLAAERVQRELNAALAEAAQEVELVERFQNPAAGMYQEHPPRLMATSLSSSASLLSDSHQYKTNSMTEIPSTASADSAAHVVEEEQEGEELVEESAAGRSSSSGEEQPASFESDLSSKNVKTADFRYRSESMGSAQSYADDHSQVTSDTKKSSQQQQQLQATMFLDEEESVFYQAEDGSLCFLSGFNMNCLRSEFSSYVPDPTTPQRDTQVTAPTSGSAIYIRHRCMPLPDMVEGKVLEVERVHLTAELRSRWKFLAHLPIYSDIFMIEIALGGLLSPETKKLYRKEFQKRQQTRQSRMNAERRADERARKKEEERINELKSRLQMIDPNDAFFHVAPPEPVILTGEQFGPSLSSSPPTSTATTTTTTPPANRPAMPVTGRTSTPSFSQITRQGGLVVGSSRLDQEFPTLGSNPPPSSATTKPLNPRRPTWGPPPPSSRPTPIPVTASSSPNKQIDVEQPTAAAVATATTGIGGKKKKSKPILLFSTSAHRGTAS